MNTEVKILNKLLENLISPCIQGKCTVSKWNLFQVMHTCLLIQQLMY